VVNPASRVGDGAGNREALMKCLLSIATFVAFSAGLNGQSADKAMTVFVTAAGVVDVAKVDKDTEKQLRAAMDAAEEARKDLEKDLEAKHGSKKDTWPQEAQDRYYDAEEAEELAHADWDYRRMKQSALADTAEDIRKSLAGDGMAGKKENVNVVSSRDEAQLIIEVVGRRSAKTLPTQLRADRYYVSFLIKQGPKLMAAHFAAVTRDYRFRRVLYSAWRLQTPTPEAPVWRFDAYGDQRWGNAANTASVVIEDFIAKNYDVIMKRAVN
jgi:hypothetical protein